MPKHKYKDHKSHSHHKKKRRDEDSSRDRSRVSNRDESPDRRSSISSRSSSRDKLLDAVQKLYKLFKHRDVPATEDLLDSSSLPSACEAHSPYPPESENASSGEVLLSDEQTVLQNRGSEPGMFSCYEEKENITDCSSADFLFSVTALSQKSLVSDSRVLFSDNLPKDDNSSLAKELFGELQSSETDSPWDSMILDSTKLEIRSGLKEEIRQNFLKKFEPKEKLEFLNPPKINRELLAALAKRQSVLKRDEFQVKSQSQVAACINALGSSISDLLQLDQSLLANPIMKNSLTKLAECLHLLTDHHHTLSLSRQAFIKPCLTFIGKTTAEGSSIDDWLFGSGFAEEFKSAQACEKAGRELTRFTSVPTPTPRSSMQTSRRFPQQRSTQRSGNYRPPAAQTLSTVRQSRPAYKPNRNLTVRHRSQSRPRR